MRTSEPVYVSIALVGLFTLFIDHTLPALMSSFMDEVVESLEGAAKALESGNSSGSDAISSRIPSIKNFANSSRTIRIQSSLPMLGNVWNAKHLRGLAP